MACRRVCWNGRQLTEFGWFGLMRIPTGRWGLSLMLTSVRLRKLKLALIIYYITAAGRHLKLNFNSRASSFLLAGAAASPFIGLAALAAQGTAAKDKGIHWWYENLRTYAPYAKSGNLGVTYIIIGAISGVALVILVFIVAIISSMK